MSAQDDGQAKPVVFGGAVLNRGRLVLRCRCVWLGERCPNGATEEDGLCDWCGTRAFAVDGGGQAHVNTKRTPDACWMEGSGRELVEIGGFDA